MSHPQYENEGSSSAYSSLNRDPYIDETVIDDLLENILGDEGEVRSIDEFRSLDEARIKLIAAYGLAINERDLGNQRNNVALFRSIQEVEDEVNMNLESETGLQLHQPIMLGAGSPVATALRGAAKTVTRRNLPEGFQLHGQLERVSSLIRQVREPGTSNTELVLQISLTLENPFLISDKGDLLPFDNAKTIVKVPLVGTVDLRQGVYIEPNMRDNESESVGITSTGFPYFQK